MSFEKGKVIYPMLRDRVASVYLEIGLSPRSIAALRSFVTLSASAQVPARPLEHPASATRFNPRLNAIVAVRFACKTFRPGADARHPPASRRASNSRQSLSNDGDRSLQRFRSIVADMLGWSTVSL
jgi:hypothetical protein